MSLSLEELEELNEKFNALYPAQVDVPITILTPKELSFDPKEKTVYNSTTTVSEDGSTSQGCAIFLRSEYNPLPDLLNGVDPQIEPLHAKYQKSLEKILNKLNDDGLLLGFVSEKSMFSMNLGYWGISIRTAYISYPMIKGYMGDPKTLPAYMDGFTDGQTDPDACSI